MLEINQITYMDYINLIGNFISLDISVRSTGWVKKENGKVTYGTETLQAKDELGRRKEFRKFLIDLVGSGTFDYVFVEDVIAGTNFKTTKGLIQLNTIIDDLKEFDVLDIKQIKRIDNKSWKKYLKEACNYIGDIKCEDDKQLIQNCLNVLGFNENVKQDIYDALGMSVALIFRDNVLHEKKKLGEVLKNDLRKGYLIKQFENKDKKFEICLEKLRNKYNRSIEEIDWVNETRDILSLFKRKINKDLTDDKIYVIRINTMKLGVLVLTKKLSAEFPISYLIITKTKIDK